MGREKNWGLLVRRGEEEVLLRFLDNEMGGGNRQIYPGRLVVSGWGEKRDEKKKREEKEKKKYGKEKVH